MKEKLKELAKIAISAIIAVLVISFLFWILGCISIKLLNLPIDFTYSMSVGLICLLSMFRGIIKFIVEGIDINTTFNVSNEQKKYKYRIVFKNGNEANGNITGSNLDELKDVFLENKANFLNQGEKLYYFNRDEIQYLQVEETKEEQ